MIVRNHVAFGHVTFVLGFVAQLSGYLEKLTFAKS